MKYQVLLFFLHIDKYPKKKNDIKKSFCYSDLEVSILPCLAVRQRLLIKKIIIICFL